MEWFMVNGQHEFIDQTWSNHSMNWLGRDSWIPSQDNQTWHVWTGSGGWVGMIDMIRLEEQWGVRTEMVRGPFITSSENGPSHVLPRSCFGDKLSWCFSRLSSISICFGLARPMNHWLHGSLKGPQTHHINHHDLARGRFRWGSSMPSSVSVAAANGAATCSPKVVPGEGCVWYVKIWGLIVINNWLQRNYTDLGVSYNEDVFFSPWNGEYMVNDGWYMVNNWLMMANDGECMVTDG